MHAAPGDFHRTLLCFEFWPAFLGRPLWPCCALPGWWCEPSFGVKVAVLAVEVDSNFFLGSLCRDYGADGEYPYRTCGGTGRGLAQAGVTGVASLCYATSGDICWTYYLLHTLQRLGLIDAAAWRALGASAATVCELELHAADVIVALTRLVKQGWADAGADAGGPRTATSTLVTMYIVTKVHVHTCCMGSPYSPDDALDHGSQPAYSQLCSPFRVLQCLARLRTGAASLRCRWAGQGDQTSSCVSGVLLC
jgi:hypothetical protein